MYCSAELRRRRSAGLIHTVLTVRYRSSYSSAGFLVVVLS